MLKMIMELIYENVPGFEEIIFDAGHRIGFLIVMKDGKRFVINVFDGELCAGPPDNPCSL